MKYSSCAAIFFCLLATNAIGQDWPQWRGSDRDAISESQGLLQEWPDAGPPLAWRIDGLGGGDSAPSIADGKIFGMSSRDGKEIVWALSESDGSEIWATSIGDAVQQRMTQSKEGPGCTPTVDGDRVYVIGMGGRVACLGVQDGKIIWQRSLTEDFGGIVPPWSYRESPLVDGEKVICTPGAADATFVALDKSNGEVIWKSALPVEETPAEPEPEEKRGRRGRGGRSGSGAGYSSAIAIEQDGVRQYVQITAKALAGVSAETGEVLWQYKKPANGMGINCSTPIYQDGLVFAASAYGAGGGAVKLTKQDDGTFEAEEVYFTPNMQNHHGGMIVIEGALYGANGGNSGGMMACIDFQTGETLWRDREGPKGSLAFADGRFYLRSEEGPIVLFEPSKEGWIEHGRFEQPDRSSVPAWAHPVIANGKLYIRDQGLLLCYDVAAK